MNNDNLILLMPKTSPEVIESIAKMLEEYRQVLSARHGINIVTVSSLKAEQSPLPNNVLQFRKKEKR